MCPLLWDILGTPTQLDYAPGGIYFNRSDVKASIHAPSHIDWTACATQPVFVGGEDGPQSRGDVSLDPIQKVLPQVIEATNRVLISNGDFGKILLSKRALHTSDFRSRLRYSHQWHPSFHPKYDLEWAAWVPICPQRRYRYRYYRHTMVICL